MGTKKDLTGQKSGRLTAIESIEQDKHGKWIWKCLCDCGNYSNNVGARLLSGHTKSCGCIKIENAKNLKLSHSYSKTSFYRKWTGIKERCCNVNKFCRDNNLTASLVYKCIKGIHKQHKKWTFRIPSKEEIELQENKTNV